ncbi:unnamed protein product [Allacma fusca]|uniref:Uncharacterized protein n=1 Tax=Allacma fusca TaxID=39272 RepID=A0A8J2KC16_9HEXA|nr:unnamed protein product [Allacma fusca]
MESVWWTWDSDGRAMIGLVCPQKRSTSSYPLQFKACFGYLSASVVYVFMKASPRYITNGTISAALLKINWGANKYKTNSEYFWFSITTPQ